MDLLKSLKNFFSIFFPFECHLCRAVTDFGQVVCVECSKELLKECSNLHKLQDMNVDFSVYALSAYNQKVAETIRIIKYRPSRKLLDQFSLIVEQVLIENEANLKFDVLIPVPMHQSRENKRGFNQAAIFAEHMAVALKTFTSPVLSRTINTRPQADCDANDRKTNLSNAIDLSHGLIREEFEGKHLCLIDDVATTGATLQNCKNILEQLKPSSVSALVVSHSFLKSSKSEDFKSS